MKNFKMNRYIGQHNIRVYKDIDRYIVEHTFKGGVVDIYETMDYPTAIFTMAKWLSKIAKSKNTNQMELFSCV